MLVFQIDNKLQLVRPDLQIVEIYDGTLGKIDRFYIAETNESIGLTIVTYHILVVSGKTLHILIGREDKITEKQWITYETDKEEDFVNFFFEESHVHFLYPDFSTLILRLGQDGTITSQESRVDIPDNFLELQGKVLQPFYHNMPTNSFTIYVRHESTDIFYYICVQYGNDETYGYRIRPVCRLFHHSDESKLISYLSRALYDDGTMRSDDDGTIENVVKDGKHRTYLRNDGMLIFNRERTK